MYSQVFPLTFCRHDTGLLENLLAIFAGSTTEIFLTKIPAFICNVQMVLLVSAAVIFTCLKYCGTSVFFFILSFNYDIYI